MPITRRSLLASLMLGPVACGQLPVAPARNSLAPVSIRRRYVDGRFGQIHLHQTTGNHSERTPLLCLHPTPVSGAYYRDFMLEMGKDRLVIALDTPGYGNSDRPPAPQPMQALAGAAADALDALGFGQAGRGAVDCIGYHTGCFIAAELAIIRPDLVRRLILPGIPYYSVSDRQDFLAELTQPTPFEEAATLFDKAWAFWVTERRDGLSLQRAAEHAIDNLRSSPQSWWAYQAVFSWPAEQRLPLVKQPVLVPNTHGSLKEQSRAAARLMPNTQLTEVPELDRSIFDLGVDRLAKLSRQFLDKP